MRIIQCIVLVMVVMPVIVAVPMVMFVIMVMARPEGVAGLIHVARARLGIASAVSASKPKEV